MKREKKTVIETGSVANEEEKRKNVVSVIHICSLTNNTPTIAKRILHLFLLSIIDKDREKPSSETHEHQNGEHNFPLKMPSSAKHFSTERSEKLILCSKTVILSRKQITTKKAS